jgi:hypothetical protein
MVAVAVVAHILSLTEVQKVVLVALVEVVLVAVSILLPVLQEHLQAQTLLLQREVVEVVQVINHHLVLVSTEVLAVQVLL